jgi:hypothetical protein
MDLAEAASRIEAFANGSLTKRIGALESALTGLSAASVRTAAPEVDVALLQAGSVLKQAAGQVNVLIHAVGILVALPHILEQGEVVESMSLGAGNTGRELDLVTNRQIAEFKFIQWRGGSESIRQNSIFQDFFALAEADTQKRRVLYLLGLDHPLKFFTGGRALTSVMSKNETLRNSYRELFGDRFARVSDYYAHRKERVEIVDLTTVVPDLRRLFG